MKCADSTNHSVALTMLWAVEVRIPTKQGTRREESRLAGESLIHQPKRQLLGIREQDSINRVTAKRLPSTKMSQDLCRLLGKLTTSSLALSLHRSPPNGQRWDIEGLESVSGALCQSSAGISALRKTSHI